MSKKSFDIDRVSGHKNDTSKGRITDKNRQQINRINAALKGKNKPSRAK